MEDSKLKNLIDERIKVVVSEILSNSGFISRKITDTPVDSLQVVNRKYVTMNGTVANRPVSSIATVGQPYLATDTGIPMTYTSAGWVNGAGSIVAQNN